MYKNAHSSTIYNNPKLKMSINRKMIKYLMVFTQKEYYKAK